MSIGLVLNHTYKQTCEICDWISKMAQIAFVAVIAFGESAGRARAASHLSSMGYYEEAKSLMLKEDKDDQSANHQPDSSYYFHFYLKTSNKFPIGMIKALDFQGLFFSFFFLKTA